MSYYIYFIHNIINNKVYIGKTINPKKRWNKHIKISLHKALKKYGVTYEYKISRRAVTHIIDKTTWSHI